MKLDDRDIQILSILQREGRISKTALAERINLSPTPCWERLKRLEAAGLIVGYRAEISASAMGPHVTVFVAVELEGHRAADMRRFETAVQDIPEVAFVWAVGGGYDYLMQVIARDIDRYQRVIDGLLEAEIGMARYYTHIVTKPVKSVSGLPLELLRGG
ncbi:Lrp/AsnC family transcriptional regulator [Anianabacter salinae]|uniref:Lrp/AsnC family transcriptional regulator n=1 Tax=Anianabacter salinae TaxID=2851023 RepID=UPI00225E3385|nr:Lrp/AsnC family transcriptional regulator [Anianabacter salinae]MBV0912005.1 Lrp/AsnC family transcriptional regulator [Anianabacter salinae]